MSVSSDEGIPEIPKSRMVVLHSNLVDYTPGKFWENDGEYDLDDSSSDDEVGEVPDTDRKREIPNIYMPVKSKESYYREILPQNQ